MSTPVLVVIVFLVLAILVVLGWATGQRRQSETLRQKFGPEYNHTVEELGDRRKAEEELAARAKRVEALDIHPLAPEERGRFAESWRATQAEFVDNPSAAVKAADRLVTLVMQARGYPMGTFEQRAADISVDYADVVENYRAAHKLAQQNEHGDATTEDLRQAMVYFRKLFNSLLDSQESERAAKEASK